MGQFPMMVHMGNFWPAPHTDSPIRYEQAIPGSKSMTNRALVLAALADSPSTIFRPLRSRDTDLMAAALRSMGVGITAHGDASTAAPSGAVGDKTNATTAWKVQPGPLRGAEVDCGLAGTVMRFIPVLAALADGPVHLDGDEQAYGRPLGPVLDALRQLGVDVEGDTLPCTITPSPTAPRGGEVTIDASGSSQFVSALLLAGARFPEGLTIHNSASSLPSLPHITMTLDMLRQAGVSATKSADERSWTVHPGAIRGGTWDVEPDLSNATPFLAAAAVTGGAVTVPGWPERTTQPGAQFVSIAEEMGCQVELADGRLTVTGPAPGELRGVDRDFGDIGELTPTVAAMAALASTPSRLTGIAHLRGHETDRLAALVTEITRLGGKAEELPDGIAITPSPLSGGQWLSYADHRMATAGAIIGLRVPGVDVENIDTTAKTLPGFAGMWEAMVRQGAHHQGVRRQETVCDRG